MVEPDEKLKLLVVDDESDNLDLLYRTFRQKFKVFRADSAMTALDLLKREGEMAIIISDQRMPFMKGTELLQRTVEQFPDTVRIVLTGYTDVEDLVDAINTGQVFKYITKPWKPQELQDIVRQAADTYRAIKQRTNDLRRALRRESVFNAVIQAIRETLDCDLIENAIAHTFGQVFAAETSILVPASAVYATGTAASTLSSQLIAYRFSRKKEAADEDDVAEATAAQLTLQDEDIRCLIAVLESNQHQWSCCSEKDNRCEQISVPLIYQNQQLAVLILKRAIDQPSWRSEDLALLEDVAQQAALALSQAKLHQRVQQQTLRFQSELEFARQIQTSLLRQTLPEVNRVALQARCLPAREVGGDFYEVYLHPSCGDIWLAVGDVSGKGIPAALLMASAISVLRQELSHDLAPAPGVVMQRLNHSLMSSLVSSNCLITMVLARYSCASSELTYANAGHVYPMIWSRPQVQHASSRPSEAELAYLKERGVPLGITAEWQGKLGRRSLHPGDVLLMVSDGITEAPVPCVSAPSVPCPGLSPPGQQDSLKLEMLRHSGLWELILKLNGSPDIDAILSHIQPSSEIREDDQTILSMEVLQP
ncbi:MAG: SpoIIE family protein phosphatase [Elainellaceae cyanobacterium]